MNFSIEPAFFIFIINLTMLFDRVSQYFDISGKVYVFSYEVSRLFQYDKNLYLKKQQR